MERLLYLVRHCAAAGQAPNAELTAEGRAQAEELARALADVGIGRIVASPFIRARESAAPLARNLGLPIELDDRLAERVLSAEPSPDWLERLRRSFGDPDLRFEGGESGREAAARGVTAVEDALRRPVQTTALVTHGNLLALLLRHFDARYGFEEWRVLSNPDVFLLQVGDEGPRVSRVWGLGRLG